MKAKTIAVIGGIVLAGILFLPKLLKGSAQAGIPTYAEIRSAPSIAALEAYYGIMKGLLASGKITQVQYDELYRAYSDRYNQLINAGHNPYA